MQAGTRHDVSFAPENPDGELFHIHQLEETELAPFVIEEQIDVRVVPRLVTRGGAEQVKMLDAELLQFGLMLPELGNGDASFHGFDSSAPLPASIGRRYRDLSELPPATHEAAGLGAGVIAKHEHRGARNQGHLVAFRALHQALAAGREVVDNLRGVEAQPVEIDQVDVGVLAGLGKVPLPCSAWPN